MSIPTWRIAVVVVVVLTTASCSAIHKSRSSDDGPVAAGEVVSDYDGTYAEVWSAVASVVQEMPIDEIDESNGMVVTSFMYDAGGDDYAPAPTTPNPKNGWIESTRYKLAIHVATVADAGTRVSVIADLECKYSTTSSDGKRYREGAWYPLTSTGAIESDVQRRIAAQLVGG